MCPRVKYFVVCWLALICAAPLWAAKPVTNNCPAPPVLPSGVMINEINPGSTWIELYNDGAASVNMAGWQLQIEAQSSADKTFVFCSSNCTIAAGEYQLISTTPAAAAIAAIDSSNGGAIKVYDDVAFALHQTIQEAVLLDSAGALVHYFRYGNNTGSGGSWYYENCDPAYSSQVYASGSKTNLCTQTDGQINVSSSDWSNWGACTPSPGTSNAGLPHHFEIAIGSGTASTCFDRAITITACADALCTAALTSYAGTIAITTSTGHGRWSGGNGGLSSSGSDNGAASYSYSAAADSGVVTLALANQHAETLTITADDGAISGTSAALTFADNVLVITEDPIQVAGRDQVMTAALLRRDATIGDCGIATDYAGARNLKTWLTRAAQDPGGSAPTINSVSLPDTAPAANNITLIFDAVTGIADFVLQTSDVGKYLLNLRDDNGDYIVSVIDSSSTTLITRPFGFDLQVAGNPAALDATGDKFVVAGDPFTVNLRAVQWLPDDDADNNGVPDGFDDADPSNNADLSDNAAAPSFGLEQAGAAETVQLTASLFAPIPGNNPGLGDSSGAGALLSSFVSGTAASSTLFFAEVGIIEIGAALADGSYLGGEPVLGVSGHVGRFYPASFVLENGLVTAALDSPTGLDLTYLGQPFALSYRLRAVNALGDTTQNYEGVFAKLAINDVGALDEVGCALPCVAVDAAYAAIDSVSATDLTSRLSVDAVASPNWLLGALDITTTARIARAAAADGPFSGVALGVLVEDSDGVAFSALDLELDSPPDGADALSLAPLGGELRYGRIYIPPLFGPEIALGESTALPFVLQYYNSASATYSSSAEDSLSSYGAGNAMNAASYSNWAGNLDPGETSVQFPLASTVLVDGAGDQITVSRPGLGNDGSVDITLTVESWLQHGWSSGGVGSENPSTTVYFGRYRGHDRIIYWQEVHNP